MWPPAWSGGDVCVIKPWWSSYEWLLLVINSARLHVVRIFHTLYVRWVCPSFITDVFKEGIWPESGCPAARPRVPMYADDIALIASSPEELQQMLNIATKYASQ